MLHASRLACAVALIASSATAGAATVEQDTLSRLDQLRAIEAEGDAASISRYNAQMDDTWKFFAVNKSTALPVIRNEMALELAKPKPSNLMLLDIGYFLYLQEQQADKDLAKRALFALDTNATIVSWNDDQLFRFSHAVAAGKDPRILPFIDMVFLNRKVEIFVPQHALKLDETLVCVFLYGVYGRETEVHLRGMLGDSKLMRKILEILTWIGTPDSVNAVNAAMTANLDYETFVRATSFMMRNGGPLGRVAMLAVDSKALDPKSREYYEKIHKAVEATSYEGLRKQIEGMPGEANLSDEELKKRLAAMYANYGKDDNTNPAAVINSNLPSAFLIDELTKIRSRTFNRISNEALGDVEITNAILNTLYYRTK
jgi:hypothetical protein